MTDTSIFETEHAKVARRLTDKLGEVYPPEGVSCTFMRDKVWIEVVLPSANGYSKVIQAIIAEDVERGLIAGLIYQTAKNTIPNVPLSAVTTSELEAWVNQHIAEMKKS